MVLGEGKEASRGSAPNPEAWICQLRCFCMPAQEDAGVDWSSGQHTSRTGGCRCRARGRDPDWTVPTAPPLNIRQVGTGARKLWHQAVSHPTEETKENKEEVAWRPLVAVASLNPRA